MIKCIIHCADIHIRNYSRHEEYAEQLEKFVEKCREIAQKYEEGEVRILIAGDLVNQKNNISNELIVFSSLFLRKLEEIAPVVVYAGNHDLVVNNTSRTDTLTALFNTAKFENCTFLDMMTDYNSNCITDDNVIWALYSIYDDFMRPDIDDAKMKNPDATVIGLYHGMVVGATLNNGSVVDEGVEGDIFEGCNYVMAGHIHKRQELKRGDVEIVYPGSLIQQTFGETVSQHGFAVWDIEHGAYEFVDIESDYNLYDMEIERMEDIDEDKEKLINF